MRRSEDFRRTVRGGVRVGRPTLVLHAVYATRGTIPLNPRRARNSTRERASADVGQSQVGFVVGKNIGNAVVRNRVRRRLRHLAAAEVRRTAEPVSVVVRALPRAATAPDEVPTDFAAAWPQAVARLTRRTADAGSPQ